MFALLLSPANPISLRADTCDSSFCGDADGDGYITVTDAVEIAHFLAHPESQPSDCADSDGYDLVTLRDFHRLIRYVYVNNELPTCVSQPKLLPAPTSELSIIYDHIIQENDSIAELQVKFAKASSLDLISFALPLFVRVNGQLPLSLSIDTSTCNLPSSPGFIIDSIAGSALFSYVYEPIANGDYIICDLIVRVEPSPIVRHVTLEYTELGPYMTGVFEPPNSACNYVMFLDDSLNAWQPELVPVCMCGDADNNGYWTISDAVFLVFSIFGNTNHLDAPCLGDANGSGGVSISDAVHIIKYVFGGPPPRCP